MFGIKKPESELLEVLPKRMAVIKNRAKLPALDELYLKFLTGYEAAEINADVLLYGYEETLRLNSELGESYPEIASELWMIGSSGQGDGWLINKLSGIITFYDHDQGEYENLEQFLDLKISFADFLRVSFLYAELEELLDERNLKKTEIFAFKTALNSIHAGLYDRYPFDYFN